MQVSWEIIIRKRNHNTNIILFKDTKKKYIDILVKLFFVELFQIQSSRHGTTSRNNLILILFLTLSYNFRIVNFHNNDFSDVEKFEKNLESKI